ncbi:MAG: hypothetical protein IT195_03945 [Microthrixaceae bacterium]|nr:hypothetical protein [Microthrixaceae bacterium]
MTEFIRIRCPRCLTDGQAPPELERLLCPVCATTSVWRQCGDCGQRHLVVEGEGFLCPNLTAQAPSAAPQLVSPQLVSPPLVSPPLVSPPLDIAYQVPARRSGVRPLLVIVAMAALAAAVALVVLVVLRSRDDEGADGARRTVEEVVRDAVEDNPAASEQACGQVALFGTDRTKVLEMLDSLPKESRDPLVESWRQRGEQEGWLPAEATTWQFPELRRAIVALLDECVSG